MPYKTKYEQTRYNKQYYIKRRNKCKKLGVCVACGKHPTPCKLCLKKQREWRSRMPKERRDRYLLNMSLYGLKRKFGVSVSMYEKLLAKQGGRCAICYSSTTRLKARRLSVDHNHKTGKIRGLLCSKCNQGIGFFNDSRRLLLLAAKYIQRVRNK